MGRYARNPGRTAFWCALIAGMVVLAVAIVAAVVQGSAGAVASSATFTASEDTFVKDTSPTRNYGQRSSLEVDNAPSVKRALLRFNVSGIPEGATITSATLSLYTVNASSQAGLLHAVVRDWSEATTTWSNKPDVGTQIATMTSPAVVGSWSQADVTSAVTLAVSGNGVVDLYLVTLSSDSVVYNSSEATSNRPTLLVEWLEAGGTPLPTRTPTPSATVTPTPTPTLIPTPTPIPPGTDILTFLPTDDAYVEAGAQADANFGSNTKLEVDASPLQDFLMEFAISGVNGRPVLGAKLRLYATNASNRGGDFRRLQDPNATWSEATVTWNTAPAAEAAVIASLGAVAVNAWYEVDITSLVAGDGVVSLRVNTPSTDGADYSSEEGAAQFSPQLVVSVQADPNAPTPTPTSTPSPTPTPDPNAAVLVGAGDISSCTSTGDEATAALLDTIPGTVYTLGDNVYTNGTDLEFANCYHPTWGRHKARTKPSAGNHDYNTPGATGYYGYFGAAAGDPTKGYHSYDLGAWHIVVINSNCSAVGGCGAGSPQEQWLRADLAAHPATCTLAYWHHARFSSGITNGSRTSMQPIWQVLYEFGADVVLSSHEHNYERFALQDPVGNADPTRGIREFVVGTGGRSHYSFGPPLANSEVRNNDTYGVLKLTLHPTSYDWQFVPEAGRTFTDTGSAPCVTIQSPESVSQELISLLENVPTSTGYRYGARDDRGDSMDTLKIIESPQGGYLGVYHTLQGSVLQVKVATSTDLLNWTFAADLDAHGSQPTIAGLSDGGFLVAYEKDSGGPDQCSGLSGGSGRCLRLRYYADLPALLAGSHQYQFDAPRTLSNCAEGTPNLYSAALSPDILHSTIDVGFHYFRNCDVDRQARGVLTDFSSWSAAPDTSRNNLFEALTSPPIGGHVGDRDQMPYKTKLYDLHEAQSVKGDTGSWRPYLYDYEQDQLTLLNVRTHGGSVSFGNPTFAAVRSPSGRQAVVVTYFLFAQSAAAGEAGELIFYKEY